EDPRARNRWGDRGTGCGASRVRGRGLCGDPALRMISLQVNGKKVELVRPTRLLDYLEQLGVNQRAVAVEHNGTILERAAFDGVTLQQGDNVEIVRMVGGG